MINLGAACRHVLLALLLAAPAANAAEGPSTEERGIKKVISRADLPGGLVLTVEPGSVAVRRGALQAPLQVLGRSVNPRALEDVAIDPTAGEVIATIRDSCDQSHKVTLTLSGLNARIENVAALALYRQRKWMEAADGFARALALDPGLDAAVTNLASAQGLAGKPEDAARTLAPLLVKAPVATYARVVSDPDLAPLLRRPEMIDLRAPAAGTARLALGKHDVVMRGKAPGATFSAKHRVVATIDDEWSWGTCTGEAQLLLSDLAGAEVVRLPLFYRSEMTTDEGRGCPFRPQARAKIVARVAAAQRLLTDLGFSPVAGEEGTVSTSERGAPRALFPRGKLGVVLGRDRIRALRGDEELGSVANPGAEQLRSATLLTNLSADVVLVRWGRGGREGCEGSDPQGVVVIPLRP